MTRIPLIFGGGAFGKENSFVARIYTVAGCQDIVDLFTSKGHKRIDTARIYGNGSSEEFIGQLDVKGSLVDTKALPTGAGALSPEKLRENLDASIKALGVHKINIFYLHAPDRTVPIKDTLAEVDKLYKEGKFKEFGLSNYYSWEVSEIVTLCDVNGWVKPTVYQGKYNAIERGIEPELIPCLRKYGLRFYAYSPLAGGLLAQSSKVTEGGLAGSNNRNRWDKSVSPIADSLIQIYKPILPVLNDLQAALGKHNLSPLEAAQRWLQHHSVLTPSDGVIVGASSLQQLETVLQASEGGPLPQEVLDVINEAGVKAMGVATLYAEIGVPPSLSK